MAAHNFKSLMKRLGKAGFKPAFANAAILPDWWDASCEGDASLLPEIEIRIARFLGTPLEVVHDPFAELSIPSYAGAQLRRVGNISRDRCAPAIHAATQIASAALRNMEPVVMRMPPHDPHAWRASIETTRPALELSDMLRDLWRRGIPVLHLPNLPSPKFDGMATLIDGRPVIVLGHDHDEPFRLAFAIAHEVGHHVRGDCHPEQPIVDEHEMADDDSAMEQAAEAYARSVLTKDLVFPSIHARDAQDLARKASAEAKTLNIDAAAVLWDWARSWERRGSTRERDFATRTVAVKALAKDVHGHETLRDAFEEHVRYTDASESDRDLLRSLMS
ncbi:MAG: ImmA/IrrE family metallo-endopeptidase [Myxococcota bacterium]|nr:ImmA/IrrE family metallo-endopeptidase [Myxococcota bacterium]